MKKQPDRETYSLALPKAHESRTTPQDLLQTRNHPNVRGVLCSKCHHRREAQRLLCAAEPGQHRATIWLVSVGAVTPVPGPPATGAREHHTIVWSALAHKTDPGSQDRTTRKDHGSEKKENNGGHQRWN